MKCKRIDCVKYHSSFDEKYCHGCKTSDNMKQLLESNNNNLECSVCLTDIDNHDTLSMINCKHYFHNECIHRWLFTNSRKCPCCRT